MTQLRFASVCTSAPCWQTQTVSPLLAVSSVTRPSWNSPACPSHRSKATLDVILPGHSAQQKKREKLLNASSPLSLVHHAVVNDGGRGARGENRERRGFWIGLPWSRKPLAFACVSEGSITCSSSALLRLLHQGAVITPTMDHTMSMQPASMMGPITQQMNHLSLGTTGSVSTTLVINSVTLGVIRAAGCCTLPAHSLSPLTPSSLPLWGVKKN